MSLCTLSLSAQQDAKLASHYFQSGEYEKSAQIFKKLSEAQKFAWHRGGASHVASSPRKAWASQGYAQA